MAYFKDSGSRGGRSSGGFGGKKFGGSSRGGFGGGRSKGGFGDRAPAEMHDAVCSDCNADCQVPFRPNGKKPVYCKNCYGAHSPNGVDERSGGPSYGRNRDEGSFDRGDRDDREVRSTKPTPKAVGMSKDQYDILNTKLDRLLLIVTSLVAGQNDVE